MKTLGKGTIRKKTIEFGFSTLLSRILGLIRERLIITYLGTGVMSDAFWTAFKIPNSLRKMFAEGALTASTVPTFVTVVNQEGKPAINRLMSLSFLAFEGALLALVAIILWQAEWVVYLIAPGFGPEQIAYAVPFLKILISFILLLSSSSLLAGALQSVNHFLIPALGPVLLNIFFITTLIACLYFQLPVDYLCFGILFAGLAQLIAHLLTYFRLGFSFGKIDAQAVGHFKTILAKFLPCMIGMSVLEINLFIDTMFASYLPPGSISLLTYAFRFMGIPLGIFATAFSTILLPHLSRVSMYAPKRLGYQVHEAAKLVFWVTIPASLLMIFNAEKIFTTLFGAKNFTPDQITVAGQILTAYLLGLFFFSINKILLNAYYALHNTSIPTIVAVIATSANALFNFTFMHLYQAPGLAIATVLSNALQSLLFAYLLHRQFGLKLYVKKFANFVAKYMLLVAGTILAVYQPLYHVSVRVITSVLPPSAQSLLLNKVGYWVWVGPIFVAVFLVLYKLSTIKKQWAPFRLYYFE